MFDLNWTLALTFNLKWALNVDVNNFVTLIVLILMYGSYVIKKCLKCIHFDIVYLSNVATLSWAYNQGWGNTKKKWFKNKLKKLEHVWGIEKEVF
jgi:hypothetical protein